MKLPLVLKAQESLNSSIVVGSRGWGWGYIQTRQPVSEPQRRGIGAALGVCRKGGRASGQGSSKFGLSLKGQMRRMENAEGWGHASLQGLREADVCVKTEPEPGCALG